MPIEQLPNYIKVTTPEQAKPLPYSRTEVIGAGWDAGLKELTYSYLADMGRNMSARYNIEDQQLSEEEFRNMPGITEDMQYFPGMTMAMANQYVDAFERRKKFELMRQNTNFATTGYYMLGSFGAQALDIVNYIPLGLPVKGAGVMANAIRAGKTNLAIETAITPLAVGAYASRGEEYTPQDIATNLAFAFGAGSGLSLMASGVRGLTNYLDAFSLMGHKGDPTELAGIVARSQRGEYNITDDFADLLSKDAIDFANVTGINIRNNSPFELNLKKIIDTTGQIYDNVNNVRTKDYVSVSYVDGVKTISGNNEAILKTLPILSKYIADNESVFIVRTDKPGRSIELKKAEIESWTDKQVFQLNSKLFQGLQNEMLQGTQLGSTLMDIKRMFGKLFEATLDDNVAFRSREIDNIRYEGEFEIKADRQGFNPANGIGKMYKVDTKTGTRTLLTNEQALEALRVLGQPPADVLTKNTAKNVKRTSNIVSKTPESRILEDSGELSVRQKALDEADKTNIDERVKTEKQLQEENQTSQVKNILPSQSAGAVFARIKELGNLDIRGLGLDLDLKSNKIIIVDQAVYNRLPDAQKTWANSMINLVNNDKTDQKINTILKGLDTNKDCG